MPSMNFKQNLNKAFGTQDAWINHASAVATGLFYHSFLSGFQLTLGFSIVCLRDFG